LNLNSYKQLLNTTDHAFAVMTDGKRFSFTNNGVSSTGIWPIDKDKKFNKVIVFVSPSNKVYIGDFVSLKESKNKYYINFTNSIYTGISKVNWTEFTDGKAPGYSRIYLNGMTKDIPNGERSPKKRLIETEIYDRCELVKKWVLEQADGNCECCNKNAPFINDVSSPFLELHHVKHLADGGSDTVNNAIAICPNCHREFHFGLSRAHKTQEIYSRINRLIVE